MSRFLVDDQGLGLGLLLVTEPAALDLTKPAADPLGHQLLDLGVEGMLRANFQGESPEGIAWAPWKAATATRSGVRRIGTLGRVTGDMLNPSRFTEGIRILRPRSARWYYAHEGRGSLSWKKAYYFHNGRPGQEPRPLFGWSPSAIAAIQRLLAQAARAARR